MAYLPECAKGLRHCDLLGSGMPPKMQIQCMARGAGGGGGQRDSEVTGCPTGQDCRSKRLPDFGLLYMWILDMGNSKELNFINLPIYLSTHLHSTGEGAAKSQSLGTLT